MRKKKINAIDLFCGAGGLTYGLQRSGVPVSLGVDIDPACEHPYEQNTGARFLRIDARDLSAADLKHAWGKSKTRVLVGCAPCQPFSTYTQGARGNHKVKWVLLKKFSELVIETKPEIVSMENVTPLSRTKTFGQFIRQLERDGYTVCHSIIDCRHYGAPQMRRRLVLLASRFGTIKLKSPTHFDEASWRTVGSAIGELPPVEAGTGDERDPLHRASRLSELNLERIRASRPGGTWRDWPKHLVADCHVKDTGKTYPGVYGRMEWEKPAPTITGQCFGFGNGRFGHPEQDRALTLREAAILQTFPPDYVFTEPGAIPQMKTIGRMIGNAVPPILGEVIGESIMRHLEE